MALHEAFERIDAAPASSLSQQLIDAALLAAADALTLAEECMRLAGIERKCVGGWDFQRVGGKLVARKMEGT